MDATHKRINNESPTAAKRMLRGIVVFNILFIILPGPAITLFGIGKYLVSGSVNEIFGVLDARFLIDLIFLVSTVGLWWGQKWAYLFQVILYFLQIPIIELPQFSYRLNLSIFHFFIDFSPRFVEGLRVGFYILPVVIFFLLICGKKKKPDAVPETGRRPAGKGKE